MARIAFVAALLLIGSVEAKVEGFRLVAGEASSPTQDAGGWRLESGKRAVVEWNEFSLAAAERFYFSQADSQSAILNRVVGKSVSEVFGSIQSNGKVVLINPNGILIGSGGRIETAGFIASTFDWGNEHFMSDRETFDIKGTSSITNLGTISCPTGEVRLFAQQVINEGKISAPRVLLHTDRGDLIWQTGEIGLSPYEQAICHKGLVEGDEVIFWSEEGITEFTGSVRAPGGKVHVLGEELRLFDNALIDVSAPFGGGEILVGGDYQGKNSEIPNSDVTWVGSNVVLNADTTDTGNGGKVIVWGEDSTSFYGTITARGGESGGDGGIAEISSPTALRLRHFDVDLGAPKGVAGTLLLDPNDIDIGGSPTTGTFSPCTTYVVSAGTATNEILSTDLQDRLANCSVTISTIGSGGTGPNNGSITFSSGVTWSTSNTLTLQANSTISIGSGVTVSCSGAGTFTAMNFQANVAANNASNVNGINFVSSTTSILQTTTGSGAITLNGTSGKASSTSGISGGRISTAGGAINLTGVGASFNGTNIIGIIVNGAISSTTGNITLTGTGGTVPSPSAGLGCGGVLTGASITSTGGNITITGTAPSSGVGIATSFGTSSITTTGTGTITLNGTGASTGRDISLAPNGGSVGAAGGTVTINGFSTGGMESNSVTVRNTGTGQIVIDLTKTGGSPGPMSNIGNTAITSSNGAISITASAVDMTKPGTFSENTVNCTGASGTIAITATTGNISMSIGNSFTYPNPLKTSGGSIGLTATAGTIQLAGTIPTGGGTFTCNNQTSLIDTTTITASGGAVLFSSTLNGGQALTITSSSSVTFTGAVGGSVLLSSMNITGDTIVQNSTVATSGTLTYNATTGSTLKGNLTTSSNIISMTGPITLSTNPVTFSTTGSGTGAAITFDSTSTINGALALTLSGGVGTITLGAAVGNSVAVGAMTVTTTNTGAGFTFQNITASSLDASGVTQATASTTATINTGSGALNFGGKIDGTSAGGQGLTLTTTGTVTLGGSVGSATRLGALLVSSGAAGLTLNASSTSSIVVNSFTVGGTVPTTLSNAALVTIDTSASPGAIVFGGTVNGAKALTLNSGTSTETFSGVVGGVTPIGALTVINTNSGAGFTFRNISASSVDASGAAQSTIVAATTVSTAASNGSINFGKIDGTQTLTLNAGSGTIALSGAVGSTNPPTTITISTSNGATGLSLGTSVVCSVFDATSATKTTLTGTASVNTSAANGAITFGGTINGTQNLTLNSGTGLLTLSGAIGGSTALNVLTLITTNVATGLALNNNITAATINASAITKAGLTGPVTLTSSGTTQFGGTIDGAQTLTLATSTFTVSGNVGGVTPLTSLVSTTLGNATFSGTVQAGSMNIAGVTGTATFNGAVSTSGASGVTFNGAAFTLGSTLTTTGGGPVTWTHTGTLTTTGLITSAGVFTDQGGGTTQLNSNITAASFIFNTPMTLNITPTFTATSGTTVFNSSAVVLPATANTQTITFALGGQALTVGGIIGNSSKPLGALSITHSATFSVAATGSITCGGAFTESGGGTVQISGAINTVGQNITFNDPVTLPASTGSVSSGTSAGLVKFNSTINGPGNISITGYNVTINGIVGGVTPLGP